ADLVADEALRRAGQFLREALGEAARGDAPRLGATDEAGGAAADRDADLRDLGGLPGAGLTADDGHRMIADERRDLVAMLCDREIIGKSRGRQARAPRRIALVRAIDERLEQRLLASGRTALPLALGEGRDERSDTRVVRRKRGGEGVRRIHGDRV